MKQYNFYVLPVVLLLAALYFLSVKTKSEVNKNAQLVVTVNKSVWAHYVKQEVREDNGEPYIVIWSDQASVSIDTTFNMSFGETVANLVDLKSFPKPDYKYSDHKEFLHFRPYVDISAILYIGNQEHNFTTLHAVDSISKHYGDLQK